MTDQASQRIRPAGRHLLTIGEDLIKDRAAAIVELVKNSYDADSPDVDLRFTIQNDSNIIISISDHGHGMSRNDVINKWLVPSTTSKVGKSKSPGGRTLQGKKGIGRYAAGILGNTLLLETTDNDGETTSLLLNWDDFRNAEYLDEVLVDVESTHNKTRSGTIITIEGDAHEREYWTEERIDSLVVELRMLIPPSTFSAPLDSFTIKVYYSDLRIDGEHLIEKPVDPFPILDAYDYRVYGLVRSTGERDLRFVNQKGGTRIEERVDFAKSKDTLTPTGCGDVRVDIRVFDREAKSLDSIRQRGLDMESGLELSRQDIRSLLDRLNGIGVYRGGFRIRPLGDPANDWLKLNARRVQNPTMRIGVNQVVGYIHIDDESKSGLIEKSARDGLKDNKEFDAFVRLVIEILQLLEDKRYRFRRARKERSESVNDTLDILHDYSDLRTSVNEELTKLGIQSKDKKRIGKLIDKEEKKKKEYAKRVKKVVDAYRGQATLGKVIEIILHEGRKPLNYFTNQIPNLQYYVNKLSCNDSDSKYSDSAIRITNGISENTRILSRLFSRIEPLTTRKRPPAHDVNMSSTIINAFGVYENELASAGIDYKITINDSITHLGWEEDIYAIFVNLIENSLFWLDQSNKDKKRIHVYSSLQNPLQIIYQDTGVGINPELLREGVIFEPGYSSKGGTGLGLTIAGDAARRSGLTIYAVESNEGARFVIERKR